MTEQQIHNLFTFYHFYNGLFNGQSLSDHHPSYLKEKWLRLIRVKGNDIEYPQLKSFKLYREYVNRWKMPENYLSDNIMMFLILSHPKGPKESFCDISELIELFEKYIGKVEWITKDEPKGLHPIFATHINKEFKKQMTKDIKREIKLSQII
jgi:hypothetical protein